MASETIRIRVLPILAAVCAFGTASVASAHDVERVHRSQMVAGSSTPVQAPAKVSRVAGTGTKLLPSGLYRVAPSVGEPLLTHGPDVEQEAIDTRDDQVAADGTGFAPGAAERQPVCSTDYYQQVLYARVSGTADNSVAATEDIRHIVGRMDAVLNSESLASGGPDADYKMLCDSSGQVQVDSIVTTGTSFSQVVAAARAAGYNTNRADYIVFLDNQAGGACGIASYDSDETLSLDNKSNIGGGYGIIYQPCWDGETPMHESGHLMGAVQYNAPNSTGSGGHCYEEADVMCYSPDGGDINQGGTVLRCPGTPRFDCNFDDYFDSAPEPGEYLDSHWNLGSPLNRMIDFTGSASVPSPEPVPTTDAPQTLRAKGGRDHATTGLPGEWRQYKLQVLGHTRWLRVRVFSAPGADVGLFLRRGQTATKNVFKCRDTSEGGRHMTCRIENPDPGTYYAGVMTRGGEPGLGFKLSAKTRR
jgi:hypothetical protein